MPPPRIPFIHLSFVRQAHAWPVSGPAGIWAAGWSEGGDPGGVRTKGAASEDFGFRYEGGE